jgi:hypothetical protein
MSQSDAAELVVELQRLRRGSGLHSHDVISRVGPRLSALAGLDSISSTGEKRSRLAAFIASQVQGLPADLRIAVQAAFALPPADQSRFLRERMEWLARLLEREPRSALRRVEAGLGALGERMLNEPADTSSTEDAHAPAGWYVDSFRAALMMHIRPVELIETRRVTITRDDVSELLMSWSVDAEVPEPSAEMRVDVLYGGELEKDERISTAAYWSGRIKLPRALSVGEQHEFQVRVTLMPSSQFRPYYLLSPFRRCDEFMIRAKFDRRNVPDQIWVLDGVPFQLVQENQAVGEVLAVDAVGEVVRTFRNLRPGLSYGLRWRSAGAEAEVSGDPPGVATQAHA